MHLHPSNFDREKFYTEHVPKSSLPSNFGGDCESVQTLHDRLSKEFMDMRDYYMVEEKQAALELE